MTHYKPLCPDAWAIPPTPLMLKHGNNYHTCSKCGEPVETVNLKDQIAMTTPLSNADELREKLSRVVDEHMSPLSSPRAKEKFLDALVNAYPVPTLSPEMPLMTLILETIRGYEPVARSDGKGGTIPLGHNLDEDERTEFGFYWEYEDMEVCARELCTLITTHAEQIATGREARLSYVFHATSREAWREIRRTGELRPGTPLSMYPRDSLVYFSYSPTRALEHGDVLLTAKLSDLRDKRYLGASEWQVGTPHPIPLEKIELVTEQPDMERLISEARFKEFDLIRGKFQVAILSPKLRQEFGEWLYKHEIELQTPTSQGEK